jgi:hypothetical protein
MKLRLRIRIWLRFYRDSIMYGTESATKEYNARMWAVKNALK